MKNIKTVIAFVSALTLASAMTAGCADKNDKNSSSSANIVYYDSSNSNSYATPKDEDDIAKANAKNYEGNVAEKTTLSGCEIIVKNVINIGERPKDMMHGYDADMMAAKIEIKNNNDEAIEANSMGDFNISVDGSNEVVGLDLNASVAASQKIDDYKSFGGEIAPGSSEEAYINFEAKKGWSELIIKYTPHTSEKSYDSVSFKVTPDMVED